MTEINQPIQKVIAWTKEHPALAVGLVAGAVGLGYLASKKMNGLTAVPTSMVDDAAGAGILGGGEDEITPLVPYVDFDPVAGIPVLPASDDGYDPPVYTWVPETVESDLVESPLTEGGGFWGDFDVSVFDNVTVEGGRPVVSDPSTPYQDERVHDLSYLFTAPVQTPYQDERQYILPQYLTPTAPVQTPYQDDRQYVLPQYLAPTAPSTTQVVNLHPGTPAFSSTVKIGH